MQSNPVVDDAARAILDGTLPDWSDLESSDDLGTRALGEQLKVLSTVARVHRMGVDRPDGPVPQARWGHLLLLDRVGAGAFGEVYRAWDTRLAREVALKLLHAPTAVGNAALPIIEEGRLLARVRHPNVATIYGAEAIGGRIGLWMEFIPGRTLEELLQSGHEFSLPEVGRIGVELCRAVSAVHAAGLLHRDIKPQNVMRADDGRIVLMDFGTGRERADVGSNAAGTPLYLAPEIFRGQPATAQSDVYSVGVVLYRLLTGGYPVVASSTDEVRRAHARDEQVDLGSVRPDLPPTTVQVIQRALAADPGRRYDSCDALAADLQPLARKTHKTAKQLWVALALVSAASVGGWLVWDATSRPNAARTTALQAEAGLPTLVPADGPVIVVRRLRNLRTEPDSELLADGLTYELIRSLAGIDGLQVRSATSSFALEGKNYSLAEIGQHLQANLVLEGSVAGSGDHVRVQAQLARVAGDTPLWTNKFDRRLTDVLAIQDEIAREVVNQLRLTLGRGQRRYNLDPSAQALYLKARALTERRGTENAQQAVKLYEQVIARDPAFAPAYAGLCDAYAFMSQSLPDVLGLPHQRALVLMRSAAEKSIALDPLLAEAHAAMGFLHSREFAWDDADRSFRRALDLNPGLLHVYTSYAQTTLVPMGRFEQAEVLLAEAFRRDPHSLEVQRERGALHLMRERYDEAIRDLERVRAVDPGYPAASMILARAQSLAGRLDDAMPYWESVSTQLGFQHWMAYAYVRAGRRAEIERLVAEPQHPYRQVLFYAALGDQNRALEALARAADEAPHRVVRLLVYPELAALRGDQRFEAVRARFGLR